ncbi:MAG: methylated-DNA--[protein]-cysteine S-methyltransferase [Actinomycetota bacterium]|nr:methylated-DNA--[protein]-cysteine S-methyltransferase [Actinomycetota bacterium]
MINDYERIKSAIIYIGENTSAQPTLDDVAAHVGLSPHHLQRLFRRWAGVSPKRFLQHLTASRAKDLLRDSAPVLDTAFAIGLSGSGRLHDLMVSTEAVTPGEYKSHGEGIEIRYGIHETPFGLCLIGVTARGICALRFLDPVDHANAIAELEREWKRASLIHDEGATLRFVERIFQGAATASEPLPLLLKGTNFQLKVWEGLLRVPEGCLISYGDLATRLGMSSATRAVASAVGANPIAYVIPCHRVLRSTGTLGGYRWGIERKLVELEYELAAGGAR